MTPEQFCYWLQGYVELNPIDVPDMQKWTQIVNHLQTVFKKVTPTIQPYPFGPGISPGPINPVNPMNPAPYNPGTWTSPTFPGTRPEVICSTSPTTGAYSTSWTPGGAGYDYMITSTQYTNKKNNERIRL